MKSILLLTFLLGFVVPSFGADRMCDKFDFLDCPDVFSGNRSTGASIPGQGASLSSVPASIANVDRTGIEFTKYNGSFDINFVTGTGVVGSGFSTTNNEGTFFGNIPIESDEEYYVRDLNTDKYKSHKFNGVVAFNLFGKAKKKKAFSSSIGLVGKYNSKTSKANGGVGLTLRGGPLSASYTRLRDDGRDGNDITYEYYTDTLSAGLKIANVAIDWTFMKNHTPERTYVKILSASVFLKKIMLTWGNRSEENGHPKMLVSEPFIVTDEYDTQYSNTFFGIQFMARKRFVFGIYHNYYLNSDLSFGFSAFF